MYTIKQTTGVSCCVSVALVIHMTQRKYFAIVLWPMHVLNLEKDCTGHDIGKSPFISEILTYVLCTIGCTLVVKKP
jgi:hypothetical protein